LRATSPIGPAVARNFTFVPSGSCGGNITATFQLQDGPTDLGTVSFTVRLGSTVVGGASGANATSIAVPAPPSTGASTGAPSNPYPSTINISGVTGTVTKVRVTLHNLNHTWPNDIDVLLVGPGGQRMVILSDAIGSSPGVTNRTYVLDDDAAAILPSTGLPASGTYRPTNVGANDPFPAPAPPLPHQNPAPAGTATFASVFGGVNPNGTWSLYVVDDVGTDVGSIAGGWSLEIITADPFCVTSPCTIGVADITQNNDPDSCGAIVHYPAPTIQGSCGVVTFNPPSGSFFSVGTAIANAIGTRQDSTTTTAPFNVTVNDAQAPTVIGGSVSKSSLWPVDHKMVDVLVSYEVGDNCSASSPISRSLSVTSNEPINGTGDGNTGPDWQVVGPNLVRLRAERAGGGNGRIYTITITATDAHGNSSSKNVTVSVPHNR
jgi:subtilisin-like proprotein convertase family protein